MCFSSPLFQHSKKYRSAASAISESKNPLNTRSPDKLGRFEISGAGSVNIAVTGENNVGESSGNSILDEKRRHALMVKSAPHLQQAIYAEEANLTERGEMGLRMNDALKPVQALLT